MKTITQIIVQQKNKGRSNLYLDGEYFCALDNFTVVKNGLKAGVQITEEELCEIQEQSELNFAFDKLLAYISKYRKTKKQALEYLTSKGYTYSVAFKAVDKLCGYGYLNDADFAENYVNEYSSKKGKMLMAMELKRKGISEKNAAAALSAVNEKPSAKAIAFKYMKNKTKDKEYFAKCYRHVLSKGFSYEAASEAVSYVKNRFGEDFDGDLGDDFFGE